MDTDPMESERLDWESSISLSGSQKTYRNGSQKQ
jgi:hypothetical protein